MSKEAEPYVLAIGVSIEVGLLFLAPIFGDGSSDGDIQTSIQHAKVIGADGRVCFSGEFRDGLTNVAIVMHDL